MVKTGIAVGINKGRVVSTRPRVARPIDKKGKLGARRKLAKEIAREVLGFAPYERRMMSHLDNGLDKRALKLAKKRLGSHKRAKAKREELQAARRKRQQATQAAH